jgi:pyruvate/2-oxoglutarate dehydrogenase complex dihydrolipoamide dehydrogenase (E3) component
MTQEFDAIIIGTGQAGPALAHRLAKAGMTVAVVERHRFGGTCVNTGCTPTKAMVASAYAAHLARQGGDFGFDLPGAGDGGKGGDGGKDGGHGAGDGSGGGVRVDLKRVMARKDRIVHESASGVEKGLRQEPGCTVVEGHARFTAPHEVSVGDARLRAPRIFVNVGGRARVPDLPGLDGVPYLTNTSILALTELPRHLVIVGGSYIGLEFGQMFRRFGSAVTIVEMAPRLLGKEDEDVSAAIADILTGEGVELRLGSRCIQVAAHPEGVAVTSACAGGKPEVHGSHLLLAVGRRPNTDDLGLDAAGVATDEHGYIVVDDQLRTGVDGVWALGDCNGKGAFTHTAYNDFEIVAANLLDDEPRRVSDRIVTYGLFIDPPLGRAGMTEAEVRRSGRQALVGSRPMSRVSRAIEKGDTRGLMKVLVDAESRQILGAAVLGVGGDEAVQCALDVMYAKAPCTTLRRAVHIHPTVAELLPTVLGDLKPFK